MLTPIAKAAAGIGNVHNSFNQLLGLSIQLGWIAASALPWVCITLVSIGFPVKWLQVAEIVGSIFRQGLDMVNFPAIL